MRPIGQTLVFLTMALGCTQVCADDFSGSWSIDLRSAAERRSKAECGTAEFELVQSKERIEGSHSFATVGCGRVNEGGKGTVKGVVVGKTAVLVVTSGRNGAVVLGMATLSSGMLHWKTVDEIHPGQPEGDSPLILGEGNLVKTKRAHRVNTNK